MKRRGVQFDSTSSGSAGQVVCREDCAALYTGLQQEAAITAESRSRPQPQPRHQTGTVRYSGPVATGVSVASDHSLKLPS